MYEATTWTSPAASTARIPSASSSSRSGASWAASSAGHAAMSGAASSTATARDGVLNAIARWIPRATANSALTGSPRCDLRSVGTTR